MIRGGTREAMSIAASLTATGVDEAWPAGVRARDPAVRTVCLGTGTPAPGQPAPLRVASLP